MHPQLLIGSFIPSQSLTQDLGQLLGEPCYRVYWAASEPDFLQWVGHNRHRIDCLLLEDQPKIDQLLNHLQMRGIFLPVIILSEGEAPVPGTPDIVQQGGGVSVACSLLTQYHQAIACVPLAHLPQLEDYIHKAIEQFLRLPHNPPPEYEVPSLEDARHFLLSLQQQRLSEKLKERLGYLGVYYKRNPKNFIRNLSPSERAELLDKLRTDYQRIILGYFSKDSKLNQLNQQIDDLVDAAFLADVSVSQIVEIHMELMDNFSKQLQIEGRSEEILLDYRLTLIDVIAHLCEMYRRSVPRER